MDILIIKLGALGDVLRTTPLLTGLKKRYPSCRIHWVVQKRYQEALWGNPLLDRVVFVEEAGAAGILGRDFDWAINLDKDPPALDLIMQVAARKRMGFGLSPDRKALYPLNPNSEYAYRLGVEDELKFRQNQKTYQEICFEQAGLVFEKEEYVLARDPQSQAFVQQFLKENGINGKGSPKRPVVIGLNTGSGSRFAGKKLPPDTYLDLIRKFRTRMKAMVLLLGGPDEAEQNRRIERLSGFSAVNTGSHPLSRFAEIVRACDLVVSGDTTAMHVAIAAQVPVVAFFASTCAAEIELYGRGKKVVSTIDCSPCYKRICPIDEQCMKDMTAQEIFEAAQEVLAG